MTSDPIWNTSRSSWRTGNGWRQLTGSGSAERAAIYRTRPTVAEPCLQLEPRRGTAQGLNSRAGVDPFQRVQGRLASRLGRREGANRPGRNGIFGLSNFRPRRHGHFGRAWGLPGRFPPLDTSRTALSVRCRHVGKRRDWPSPTWDRSDSSKNLVPNIWNHSKSLGWRTLSGHRAMADWGGVRYSGSRYSGQGFSTNLTPPQSAIARCPRHCSSA